MVSPYCVSQSGASAALSPGPTFPCKPMQPPVSTSLRLKCLVRPPHCSIRGSPKGCDLGQSSCGFLRSHPRRLSMEDFSFPHSHLPAFVAVRPICQALPDALRCCLEPAVSDLAPWTRTQLGPQSLGGHPGREAGRKQAGSQPPCQAGAPWGVRGGSLRRRVPRDGRTGREVSQQPPLPSSSACPYPTRK